MGPRPQKCDENQSTDGPDNPSVRRCEKLARQAVSPAGPPGSQFFTSCQRGGRGCGETVRSLTLGFIWQPGDRMLQAAFLLMREASLCNHRSVSVVELRPAFRRRLQAKVAAHAKPASA